jgi:hypothetical protein
MNHKDPECGNNFSSLRGEEHCGLLSTGNYFLALMYVAYLLSQPSTVVSEALNVFLLQRNCSKFVYIHASHPRKWCSEVEWGLSMRLKLPTDSNTAYGSTY